jgi:hypothetical protein
MYAHVGVAFVGVGDVLGSPVWTVLTTLLTAAAIWVSVALHRRSQQESSAEVVVALLLCEDEPSALTICIDEAGSILVSIGSQFD